jgi:3-deoxy-D-manno-octulosonate 8-phosphate phosphatase (KDO 8-P phosphatase)
MRKMNKKIENLILDVDGVLTTGQFLYIKTGKYAKVFGPHDSDGIKMISKHIKVLAVTADRRGFAITKKRVRNDMKLPLSFVKEEERLEWMKNNFDLSKTVYMGDGIFDAFIFKYVKYSIAPNNAFYLAKEKADFVTRHNAGEGAVAEACMHLLDKFLGGTGQMRSLLLPNSGVRKK